MKENEKKVIIEQLKQNINLALLCKENNITNLRITSIGNSIAAGYSMARTIRPLLLRNESLNRIMTSHNINLDLHQYARAQNNNDEHVFNWVTDNITESEIEKMNVNDYSEGKTSMPTNSLIKRAEEILNIYESEGVKEREFTQTSLFSLDEEEIKGEDKVNEIEEMVKGCDPLNMTPINALNFLYELKEKIRNEEK